MKTTHFGSLIALTLLSGFSLSLFGSDKKGQQAKTEISGIITDYFKEAMVRVTVVNRTNNKHTYSDIDGHYIISASPGDTLSFRYIRIYGKHSSCRKSKESRYYNDYRKMRRFISQ
ncbi:MULTISPECIES: peptidase associated/transthyretin-like domain-containing protein [Dysgonomonas]|uniref:hypothetical protein n=1 Tax=Dysgonomonas TaxID=156973 RepID=UPI0012FA24D9|nr:MULTISPECIES: hypothetical protein [Dysgonomonas]MBS7121366.1 hypothetical protein [Dysgonomonas sp.]